MQRLLAIILVTVGLGQAYEVQVSTCNQKTVRECKEKFGITLQRLMELNSASTRCFDAFELDESYRCSHDCILKQLMAEFQKDLFAIFVDVLYCDVNPKRIEYLFKHCSEMVRTESAIFKAPCGENYAIHRCIQMHLNIYPPGSHPPSFCAVRPPTKDQCIKEALSIDGNFCLKNAPGWYDNFTSPADMCFEVCLLRGMGYIVKDQVATEVWYNAAFPFLPKDVFDNVFGYCTKEVENLGIVRSADDCRYFYDLFKCVQYFLGPNNDASLIRG